MGRIDGWIMAMPESDMALKKLGLKNVRDGIQEIRRQGNPPSGEKGKEVTRYSPDSLRS